MMRFPGKGAPGGHLGPQNALDFIRFNKGLRNRAAKNIFPWNLGFSWGKAYFYSRPRNIGITNVFNRVIRHRGTQNALYFIRFNRGLRHWAARSTFPGQGRAGPGLARPGQGGAGQALPCPALAGQGKAGPSPVTFPGLPSSGCSSLDDMRL